MPQAFLRNRERELASQAQKRSDARRRGPNLPSGLRRLVGDPAPASAINFQPSSSFLALQRAAQARAANAAAGAARARAAAAVPPTPFRLESQASQGAGPGLPVGTFTDGRTVTQPPLPPSPRPTGPAVIDIPDSGNTVSRAFNPYPTTLPPLSPEMLQALEDRRALSLRRLQEAEARAASQRQSAELANVGRMLGIEEETGRERREGLSGLAARGVARSPLFANPFRRELARQQQQQIGESQQQLTSTLDQLGEALRAAQFRREEELSQLAFDETRERSNVNRLLGVE